MEALYSLYKKCSGVTTDSRAVTEGSMFFALKGENFDGNDFALAALEKGARIAVVDRPSLQGGRSGRGECFLVENALEALQQLAAYHRRQFRIPVVGITGTNGKTTTKELVAAVLSCKFNLVSTKGNLNNHIGVPLTLFGINEKTQAAVIEMGASAPGEIATLTAIAQPTCGLITNVGKAHLLGFGSFEGVKRTKGELYDYLRQNGGQAFYNADNPVLCDMISSRSGLTREAYGVQTQGVEVLEVTAEHPFLRFRLPDGTLVETHLVGAYNADNALAALRVGAHFGVAQEEAVAALAGYVPSNDRSQMVRTENNVLIVDTYNANPTSMGVALDNFARTSFREKTLILGDMLELGPESAAEHAAALARAMTLSKEIYLVGEAFTEAAKGVRCAEAKGIQCFPDSEALRVHLQKNPVKGRTVLIKGSHGIHLEKLPEVL